MEQQFDETYEVKPDDDFWGPCPVEGCKITFPHEVGRTKDHEWRHVRADLYSPTKPND
jgi:hypothetical protein